MTLAFIHSPIDRQSAQRVKPEILEGYRHSPARQLVKICKESVLMQSQALHLSPLPDTESDSKQVFLGLRGAVPWFAAEISEAEGMVPLRQIMLEGLLPATELSILAQAKSMLDWHRRHGFCANCGTPTQLMDAGYRRHCEACAADHFPRTDPVVIMAVCWQDQILLGRQAAWAPGMYSALAGFMEPGETIEQAVAREVFEEVGVETQTVQLVANQPWPFPSSLMLGAIATAKARTLKVDTSELETARWFSRDEIVMMLRRQHPEGLFATHPYAIAHHLISEAVTRL